MTYFFSGIDEAGYGPTLGPLVVGCCTFSSPKEVGPASPWKLLAPSVLHKAKAQSKGKARKIAVADSKLLYKPKAKSGLAGLEIALLPFLSLIHGHAPKSFLELMEFLTASHCEYLNDYPWYKGKDFALPVNLSEIELAGSIRKLSRAMERAELNLVALRTLPLEVCAFNQLLAEGKNKSDVNAWAVGRFLRQLLHVNQDSDPLHDAWVDRLGGKTHYGPYLYPLFPGAKLNILEQSHEAQSYEIEKEKKNLRIHFRTEQESKSFPTALASMAAKYVRELHMKLFNEHFQQKLGEIKPTAGYPLDARRFLQEIQPMRQSTPRLDSLLIRKR